MRLPHPARARAEAVDWDGEGRVRWSGTTIRLCVRAAHRCRRVRAIDSRYPLPGGHVRALPPPTRSPSPTPLCLSGWRPDLPLVFGCSAGKDRSGVAAALVLACLGVRGTPSSRFHADQPRIDLERALFRIRDAASGSRTNMDSLCGGP
jgi:hypothetical protein